MKLAVMACQFEFELAVIKLAVNEISGNEIKLDGYILGEVL